MLLSLEKRNAHGFKENVSFVTYLVECPIWAVRWALSWWRGCKHLVKGPWRFRWLLRFATGGNRKQQPREKIHHKIRITHIVYQPYRILETLLMFFVTILTLGRYLLHQITQIKCQEGALRVYFLQASLQKSTLCLEALSSEELINCRLFFCLSHTSSLSYRFLSSISWICRIHEQYRSHWIQARPLWQKRINMSITDLSTHEWSKGKYIKTFIFIVLPHNFSFVIRPHYRP